MGQRWKVACKQCAGLLIVANGDRQKQLEGCRRTRCISQQQNRLRNNQLSFKKNSLTLTRFLMLMPGDSCIGSFKTRWSCDHQNHHWFCGQAKGIQCSSTKPCYACMPGAEPNAACAPHRLQYGMGPGLIQTSLLKGFFKLPVSVRNTP